MVIRKIIFFILVVVLGVSCSNNIRNLKLEGVVKDEQGKSIPNAKIVILYWEDIGLFRDEFTYSKEELHTNNKGEFICNIKAGCKLDIAISAKGYKVWTTSIDSLSSNTISKEIILNLQSDNCEAIYYYGNRLTLGTKICKDKDKETIIGWGIDVKLGESTEDKEKANIWMKDEKQIVSQKGGGIIPIYKQGKDDILNGYAEAPINGYRELHNITGEEIGYFIMTKDSYYGKLIISYPFEKEEMGCIHKGVLVKLIYQPDKTNCLKVGEESLDLEMLLLNRY